MSDTITRLNEAVSAVCPIAGVSVGLSGVSSSVKFTPLDNATAPQKTAAQSVIDSFDWNPAAQQQWEDGKEPVISNLRDQAAVAIANIDSYLAGADVATAAAVRAEVKAINQRQRQTILVLVRIIQKLLP